MIIDLHIHTTRTPGSRLDLKEALRQARKVGLDGVCITEFNTLEGWGEVLAAGEAERVAVFVGVEVETGQGHLLCLPFLLEEGVEGLVPPLREGELAVAEEVMGRFSEAGGAVIAAHPYDRDIMRPMGDLIYSLTGLHAVEAINGRRRPITNELALEAAERLGLPAVGGSDARDVTHLGSGATLLPLPIRDQAGLVRAIMAGNVWSISLEKGPTASEGGRAPRRQGGRVPAGPRDRGR